MQDGRNLLHVNLFRAAEGTYTFSDGTSFTQTGGTNRTLYQCHNSINFDFYDWQCYQFKIQCFIMQSISTSKFNATYNIHLGGTIGTGDVTWSAVFTAWKNGQPTDDVAKREKQDCVKVFLETWLFKGKDGSIVVSHGVKRWQIIFLVHFF